MKILPLLIAVLLALGLISAQEPVAGIATQGNPAAIVREIKGVCYVRANGAAKPRKVKADEKIEAGEELQCEAKGRVVLRFQNSGGVKEVTTTSPNWFVVPNVPGTVVTKSAFKPASRSKGDLLPPLVQTVAVNELRHPGSAAGAAPAFDEVTDYWSTRKKYYLIVAVSPAEHYKTDAFTKTDSTAVSMTLKTFGYQELAILKGQQPTHDNVVSALRRIRDLGEDALVLVYYSGHAFNDGKNLWLQLSGQQAVGDHYGISVTDLIGSARGDSFKGELALVLDTCYGGQGLRSSRLSVQDIENTTIFASSRAYQKSYTKTLPSGVEISAFTYHLIRGLVEDFSRVDSDDDGIIEYGDLQSYISNKLVEDYADESLPGQMKPEMLSHAQRGWIAYDPKLVQNKNTEARLSLILEKNSILQDPEKLEDGLPDPLPDNASPYLQALKAIDDEDWDRGWKLLQDAENEKSVSLAQINWTRSYVKLGQGQPGPARIWIQRAVDLTRKPPPELLLAAGGLNFAVGHLVKAEEFFKQGLANVQSGSAVNGHAIDGLLFLTLVNFFQGDRKDVELYAAQLRAIDPKVLEEHEEGLASIIKLIDVFSSVLSENSESALQALMKLKESLRADKRLASYLSKLIEVAERALRASDDEDAEQVVVSLSEQDIQEWKESLSKKDAEALGMVLFKVRLSTLSEVGGEALASPEVKELLKQSIEFTGKARQRKITITDAAGTREIDVQTAPETYAIENAQLLGLLAQVYAANDDAAQAESLFKQSMAILKGVPGGPLMGFQSALHLAKLYESKDRGAEAVRLYRKLLEDLAEPLGDANWLSFLIQGQLAEVYQEKEQWEEAEAAYRMSLEVGLTLFGSSSFLADSARQDLSKFLVARDRHGEAAQLLEEMIAVLEGQRDTWPVLIRDSLGDEYFQLGKSYHLLNRLEQAEIALVKSFEFLSKRADSEEAFECLHWRWATLHTLKKTVQAEDVYKGLIKIVNDEIAKRKPSTKLGAALITTAVWFRDSSELEKAEELLQAGLRLQRKAYALEGEEVAQVHVQLGYLGFYRHSFATAHRELQIAESMYRKITPLPSDKLADVLLHLGHASYQKQEYEQALPELQEAQKFAGSQPTDALSVRIAIVERALSQLSSARLRLLSVVPSKEPSDVAERLTHASIFLGLTVVARLEKAAEERDKWMQRVEAVLAPVDRVQAAPVLVQLQYEQALRELDRGRVKQGEQLLKDAIEKGRFTPGLDWLVLADSMEKYAAFLRSRGKEREAVAMEAEAKKLKMRLKQ